MSSKVASKTPPRQFDPIGAKVDVSEMSISFKHYQGELFSDFVDPDSEPDEEKPDGKAKAAGE